MQRGTGLLGLSLTKRFPELLSGTIDVGLTHHKLGHTQIPPRLGPPK